MKIIKNTIIPFGTYVAITIGPLIFTRRDPKAVISKTGVPVYAYDELDAFQDQIDVLILYGLTFFAAGVVCFIFLWIKNKKIYNPFNN